MAAGADRRLPGKGLLFRAGKRFLDVVLAAAALVVTGPLILLGILAVKLTCPGPAFYRAKRAGRGGRPFVMFKLRTMRVQADTPDRKVTEAHDDRLTFVGRWLRKFKIDEFPQFWNVLRGDMSIVGPRPEDWDLVQEHYTAEQRVVLAVRPGIASPVDVRWYPDLTYHDPPPPGVPIQDHYLRRHLPVQLAEALRYVQRQSLLLDLQVILRLIFCVLVRSWLPPRKQPLPEIVRSFSREPLASAAARSETRR
jgi:lipopolysaccharide/colanic/teichoic acid biosynthesis glycosyltransferase